MSRESILLGKNLKKVRTGKGMSQGDIAKELGVSRGYLSNIEHGKMNPTLTTIVNLAKALGVTSDALIK